MTEEKGKIILFPQRSDRIIPPKTLEEVYENTSYVKETHVDDSIDYLFEGLLEQIGLLGFPIREDIEKDHIFLYETIKSLLYNYYGLEHPIQELIEKTMKKNDDEYVLDLSKISFKKERKSKKKELDVEIKLE